MLISITLPMIQKLIDLNTIRAREDLEPCTCRITSTHNSVIATYAYLKHKKEVLYFFFAGRKKCSTGTHLL